MHIRWRGLELPNRLVHDEAVSTDTYGKFIVEPFERGFGTTVGNSLRRILLSSLEGAAVYAVKIVNAPHEFSTLPGVLEDVADIILNVKRLVISMESDEPATMKVSRSEAGEVLASQIEAPTGVEIMNPDLKIATLTEDVSFEMEMRIRMGRGYATAEENAGPEQEIGVLPIDSIFSPVTRVRYRTEDTRVGQRTNYDRLLLEVWTRGSIAPEDAVVEAAKILRKHLNPFLHHYELGEDMITEAPVVSQAPAAMDEQLQAQLSHDVSELQLSVRASNCLEAAHISTIGELVSRTEADLLRVRSFGRTSLREVKRKLAELGLELGMNLEAGRQDESEAGLPQADRVESDPDDPQDEESSNPGSGDSSISLVADRGMTE